MKSLPKYKGFLWILAISLLFIIPLSCKTISTFDTATFTRASELKARTLVLMDHGTEPYINYVNKVDDVMIEAQTIYAMQKARPKNTISMLQWKLLVDSSGKSMLPGFFNIWK